MSSLVYLKEPQELGRTEMLLESFDCVSVQYFKDLVSKKVLIPTDQLVLMYGGRVLKSGTTLDHYNIINGVTIYYMRKRENTNKDTNTEPSQLRRLIQNPRVHQILTRILSNPLLLSSVTRGTPLENHPGILSLVSDPIMQANASDPESLIRSLESNPSQRASVEAILQSIGAAVADERGCTSDEIEDDDIVDLLEQSLEDSMEFIEEDNHELVDAQEQMYQHSQSILAHQQIQTQEHNLSLPPHPTPPTYIRQSSDSATSPSITQNMLANALSTVSPNETNSLPDSMYLVSPQSTQSGPSSLPANIGTGDSSRVTTDGSRTSFRSSGNIASGSLSPHATGGSFSQMDLQRALQSVTAVPSSQPQRSRSHRSGRHNRYQTQLQHLYGMGITDEAACLHALDATHGDLDAALELLLGTGQ